MHTAGHFPALERSCSSQSSIFKSDRLEIVLGNLPAILRSSEKRGRAYMVLNAILISLMDGLNN